jgi:hypothetical protein
LLRLLALIGIVPAAAGNIELANLTALVVAFGTAAAGLVAYFRLRQDRPKVVEEVAGLAEGRLREELRTAWEAVDRLRAREEELETRVDELERERDAQAVRIVELERCIHELGLGPASP